MIGGFYVVHQEDSAVNAPKMYDVAKVIVKVILFRVFYTKIFLFEPLTCFTSIFLYDIVKFYFNIQGLSDSSCYINNGIGRIVDHIRKPCINTCTSVNLQA